MAGPDRSIQADHAQELAARNSGTIEGTGEDTVLTMSSHTATKDKDIRIALHAKRFRHLKAQKDTLVIDELGLAHAKSRIDVAVINGCIHGYEIKSARDTLDRIATQIDIYRQTLQKLTIVAATKHVDGIIGQTPEWCGVLAAEQGSRGGISFHVLRNPVANPEIDPVMLAHLLWRDEVIELLGQAGYASKDLRRPRRQLYEMLCEVMTLREITASIRRFMVQRQTWRARPAHA
jgi:hypothetical protein